LTLTYLVLAVLPPTLACAMMLYSFFTMSKTPARQRRESPPSGRDKRSIADGVRAFWRFAKSASNNAPRLEQLFNFCDLTLGVSGLGAR